MREILIFTNTELNLLIVLGLFFCVFLLFLNYKSIYMANFFNKVFEQQNENHKKYVEENINLIKSINKELQKLKTETNYLKGERDK
ncbi:hypothetical protein SYNTR_0008 [Candidatus Syntrophocurvum alkaliphilum]|uniref:Uncharacterized protein n=1 Tax=Candidatus Syntrophocurvum alkaliphilum TaxID=2293317 RepID=A0A6I6DDA6_9FIRM|nr:hypothetical protein SYNTR_0008 [Candidatus Syntrophocurvum alkaliphilum]